MSRREPKAGEWLRQQIDELGALRNASVRDPQFKAWRQNTLTFIQRIWPGDTTKSERFRRIPFTPPSTKHDARAAREYYERGCGEALEYLNALLASLGDAQSGPAVVENERHPESFEGDFPEVDLGGGPATPVGAAPPAALDDAPLDLPAAPAARGEGPPELPASAGRPEALGTSGEFLASAAFLDPEAETPGHVPASGGEVAARPPLPAPPREPEPPQASRISVRGNVPRERPVADTTTPPDATRVNPLADILGPAREQARRDADRGAVHVRKDKPREAAKEASREVFREPAQEAARETPREAAKEASREVFREPAQEAARETPREAAKEASREVFREPAQERAREVFREPAKEAPREAYREPAKAPREAQKNGKKKSKTPKPRLKDMLGLASLEQGEVPAPAPPVPPSPVEADLTREAPLPATVPFEPTPPAAGSAPPSAPEAEGDREIPVLADETPAFAGGLETSGAWSLPEFMTPPDPAHAGRETDATSAPSAEATGTPAPPVEPSHEALSATHVESLPAVPAAADEPEAPHAASDEDPGHTARVTAEFLDKSPVLSSVPRPVTRAARGSSPDTASARPSPAPLVGMHSDASVASRVLAIAAEVDQLGVPEGHRARARAALMDLARQLDEPEVAWDVLRDAVHFVMEFPPLARRTLPLLLPYLDRAA